MELDSGLLLSGNPIGIARLGTVKSPLLKEIYKDYESLDLYYKAIGILKSDTKTFRQLVNLLGKDIEYSDLSDMDYEEITKYNLIIHSISMRELFAQALSFFICEDVTFYPQDNCFAISKIDNGAFQIVGVITESNYLDVEDIILQLLYQENENEEKLEFDSEKAKKIWMEIQEHKASRPQAYSKDYQLDNLISKLCVSNTGYTIFNIYNLTVYQLYDQFYSYANNRVSSLCENAYAHNGGEQFDMNMWLHCNKK